MTSDYVSRENLFRGMKRCVASRTRAKILERAGREIDRDQLYSMLREEVSERVAKCVLANLEEEK